MDQDLVKSTEHLDPGVYMIVKNGEKTSLKKRMPQGYPEIYQDNPKGDTPAMSSECSLIRHF